MLPTAATDFYRGQQRVNAAAARAATMHWRRMSDDFDASWRRVGPGIIAALVEAQQQMTTRAATYVPRVLAETGIADRPAGEFQPGSLVGIASDGRRLDSLAYGAVAEAKTAVGDGATAQQGLAVGGNWLDLMVKLQVADAARQAVGILTASRPNLGGTVRVLTPPSCQRCAILAGRFYRWSTGFRRHPRCFPAGVMVAGPGSEAASRRWFEGELVVLTTASGQELPLTGNHPVLTSRGWVPANLVREGDEVVRSTRPEDATALEVPDHHQVPARIEDVWSALSVTGLHSMESTAEDFHGDGQQGQVDVVGTDGALNLGMFTSVDQHGPEFDLTFTARPTAPLHGQRSSVVLDLWDTALAGGFVGLDHLGLAFDVGQSRIAHETGLAHSAPGHSGILQNAGDRPARDAVFAGEGVLTGPGFVGAHDAVGRHNHPAPRWDAPTLPDPMEQRAGYAAVGLDLLDRLAGQVELDRVIFSRSVEFRGHVYSLTSSEGWHVANSLIVSNCDCVNLPSQSAGWAQAEGFITDPMDAYRAGQIRDLTQAQRFAIDNGADIGKVVNATRGMSTTATRRAVKFKRGTVAPAVPGALDLLGPLRRAQQAQGALPAAEGLMTPEGIYQLAGGDRAKAIDLLREWGYLT